MGAVGWWDVGPGGGVRGPPPPPGGWLGGRGVAGGGGCGCGGPITISACLPFSNYASLILIRALVAAVSCCIGMAVLVTRVIGVYACEAHVPLSACLGL